MGRTGDSWRWNTVKHPIPHSASISVIEPAKSTTKRKRKRRRRTVRFGFARALDEDE